MKRWHKRLLDPMPEQVIISNLQKIFLQAQVLWVYFSVDPYPFTDTNPHLILAKVEFISLPYIDVYSIRVGSIDGVSVGYAFDVYGKVIKYNLNFLLSSNFEFSRLSEGNLNPQAFDLKYKLGHIFLYEYSGACGLVSLPLPENVKETLEIK